MPKYPCTTCGLAFPSEEALLAHVGSAHPGREEEGPSSGGVSGAGQALDFPKQLTESTAKEYAAWKETEGLGEEERKAKFRHAVRVNVRYTTGLRKELRSGDQVWYSDSGKAVGGKGEYPGALEQFIAGLPLCQMTHYVERASVSGLKLQGIEISAVGRYVALSGYGFDSVDYEVRVASAEPADRIKELASTAAKDCYVTNTLKKSSKVSGKVFLNGEHILDL